VVSSSAQVLLDIKQATSPHLFPDVAKHIDPGNNQLEAKNRFALKPPRRRKGKLKKGKKSSYNYDEA
jgi:hypothetical protein